MNKSILEIIDRAGGDLMVAYTLALHQQTVKRWAIRGGIPSKYWRRLAEMAGVPLQSIKDTHTRARKK